jgi:hypothetical protein
MLSSTVRSTALICYCAFSLGGATAQPRVPDSSLYVPKPSQDLSWAHGDWVARGEHPVQGEIAEWRVHIGANGKFTAELRRTHNSELGLERGIWTAIDREVWSFTTYERDRKTIPSASLVLELYTILSISHAALELRHIQSGKVLRLERGSSV